MGDSLTLVTAPILIHGQLKYLSDHALETINENSKRLDLLNTN